MEGGQGQEIVAKSGKDAAKGRWTRGKYKTRYKILMKAGRVVATVNGSALPSPVSRLSGSFSI